MAYKLVCPHCHSSIRIRTSIGDHIFLRRAYLQCTNEACGFTAIGAFEITHELSPSGQPNPAARLPVAPTALRRQAFLDVRGETQQLDLVDILEREETDDE